MRTLRLSASVFLFKHLQCEDQSQARGKTIANRSLAIAQEAEDRNDPPNANGRHATFELAGRIPAIPVGHLVRSRSGLD
jgi:hypothetical protein